MPTFPLPLLRGRLGVGWTVLFVVPLIVLCAVYVLVAFTAPSPLLRIAMRFLPVAPLAVWTLWFDRSRPFQRQRPLIRVAGRVGLFILVMLFTIAFLGIALNWLYDPTRVV